jgi:hypothetical protein
MIAGSNGMKTTATTDPERFYVKLEEPGQARSDMIKNMFESFKAAAEAQENARNN